MTSSLRRALIVLSCLAVSAALLSACGGKDEADAQQILEQTFGKSAAEIENGRMDMRFQLDPEGLLALGGPIKLTLKGPFASPRGGDLPRFDVDFVARLARLPYAGGLQSTGTRAFLTAGGGAYEVDAPFVARLRRGLGSGGGQPGLSALGIDPLRWTSAPKKKGNETIGGVDTIRIGGEVQTEPLLSDLDALLTKAGGSSEPGDGSLLTPQVRRQLADAVDSATFDIWTGAEDKLMRQLAVVIKFAFKDGSPSPIQGLEGGTIKLRLRLDAVNETKVSVRAPRGARPIAELTGGGLENFLRGIGSGLTGGSDAVVGGAFLKCITGAAGSTTKLLRCVSKVGG